MYYRIWEFFRTSFSKTNEFFGSEFVVHLQSVDIALDTVETEDMVAGGKHDGILLGEEADGTCVAWDLHVGRLLIILWLLTLKLC